jgi:2-amino-4-hydroxy-6-hydroxymethyldihydropteridine diphosphokinase
LESGGIGAVEPLPGVSMTRAYLGLGSNIGERSANIKLALALLEERGESIVRRSSLYETEPWGVRDQPLFLNMAVEVETNCGPRELFALCKKIERDMGRDPAAPRWGPRVIDLDILLYEGVILREPEIEIPHPRMHERLFVLDPLSEIAPQLVHPVLLMTIGELRMTLGARGQGPGAKG